MFKGQRYDTIPVLYVTPQTLLSHSCCIGPNPNCNAFTQPGQLHRVPTGLDFLWPVLLWYLKAAIISIFMSTTDEISNVKGVTGVDKPTENYRCTQQFLSALESVMAFLILYLCLFVSESSKLPFWTTHRSILWSDAPISRATSLVGAFRNHYKSLLKNKSVLWPDNAMVEVWSG